MLNYFEIPEKKIFSDITNKKAQENHVFKHITLYGGL